jgi:preprotein translocase subunit SecE
VARNRKRRTERRPHRPTNGPVAEPGIATARASRREDADEPHRVDEPHREDAPDPIEHGTPDVELAEAQLAVGRPEPDEPVPEDELAEEAVQAGGGRGGRVGRGPRRGGGGGRGGGGDAGGELAPVPSSRPAPRAASRLIQFLQGSWRELQRVQWPDRRQVIQATGVVIGFVIVAGVYLGLADEVATKLVNFILK